MEPELKALIAESYPEDEAASNLSRSSRHKSHAQVFYFKLHRGTISMYFYVK